MLILRKDNDYSSIINNAMNYLQILNLLQEGGAERSIYFSDFVTHLIAGYEALENDISQAKDIYEIPAVTQNWVLCSVKCNKLLPYPFTQNYYFKINITCSCKYKIIFCVNSNIHLC